MTTAAKFEIEYLQYLDPAGKATGSKLPKFASDRETMLDLYRRMSLVRVFDKKAIALQRTGQLGTYASSLGHEATHVAHLDRRTRSSPCTASTARNSRAA